MLPVMGSLKDLDWKLVLVLVVHVLAVGVMYGRITSDIEYMKKSITRIEDFLWKGSLPSH